MKRFKKVLALVLAGVMALAMLSACGITDPDKIMPEDGTPEVVMTVNHMAAESKDGLSQLDYSRKYSEITKQLLDNWLTYGVISSKNYNTTTYWAKYDEITKNLGNVQIVVGMTRDSAIPTSSTGNPAPQTSFKYDTLFTDSSKYELADTIGVAFETTENGTKYQAVCLFKTK